MDWSDDEFTHGYSIDETSDGIVMSILPNYKGSIDTLPQTINIISFSDEFDKPIDLLPNQLSTIFFGSKFNHHVDNLPSGLKFISFGSWFNQSIDCLPDSIEEIRISQFYDHPINKLPKSLKRFNVVRQKKIIRDIIQGIATEYTESVHGYWEFYSALESKYPDIQFIY